MPVFFFIDPDIMDDPQLRNVRSVTLSYTFFQTDLDYDDEEEEEESGGEKKDAVTMQKAA